MKLFSLILSHLTFPYSPFLPFLLSPPPIFFLSSFLAYPSPLPSSPLLGLSFSPPLFSPFHFLRSFSSSPLRSSHLIWIPWNLVFSLGRSFSNSLMHRDSVDSANLSRFHPRACPHRLSRSSHLISFLARPDLTRFPLSHLITSWFFFSLLS